MLSYTVLGSPTVLAASDDAYVLSLLKQCKEGGMWVCHQALSESLKISPSRAVAKDLERIMATQDWYFGKSSTHYAAALPSAMRYHAPADRLTAAQAFTNAVVNYPQESNEASDQVWSGLLENLSAQTPADIRAQAVLNVTFVADDSMHPHHQTARDVLRRIAHLTAAPTPPVRKPGEKEVKIVPIVDPYGSGKKKTAISIAAVVGVAALAGGLVWWGRRKKPIGPAF